jgi:hypothetical protein
MYRITEEIAHKILRNIRNPKIGSLDITQEDPFTPKSLNSVGVIDCYCAIGTEFNYSIEFCYPVINAALPQIPCLEGFWLYRKEELQQPSEPFSVPRYLADPNIKTNEEMLDVTDCSIVVPDDISKMTCVSILTFEQLIRHEPMLLDCLKDKLS